jgi:hypothetical protein
LKIPSSKINTIKIPISAISANAKPKADPIIMAGVYKYKAYAHPKNGIPVMHDNVSGGATRIIITTNSRNAYRVRSFGSRSAQVKLKTQSQY